jgi:hypothetical protein
MKKNINIKIFMQSHVKNVQFAAVTVMGLGIALFCSGYTVPEGCTPSVTVSCNAGAGSCIAAATTATCVGDDASDSVTASNSLNTSFTYNLNNLSVTGSGCYTTTWSNLVDIQFAVTGVNKITATSAELQMTSSAADLVVHSDGCVWNYVNGGKSYSPDLLSMPIYISCFPSGEMLQVYETPGTEWVAGCLGSWIIRMTDFGDDDYKYPDANGDIGIGDRL